MLPRVPDPVRMTMAHRTLHRFCDEPCELDDMGVGAGSGLQAGG